MTELLAERVARRAAENPETTAVVSARETVDYGRFWSQVARTAAGSTG